VSEPKTIIKDDVIGVHITYGMTPVRLSELPKVLRDVLAAIPVQRTP
jgi:hypothetical protein